MAVVALVTGCRPHGENATPNASMPAPIAQHDAAPHPKWAVSPASPGRDKPPAGRSLFDFITHREQDGRLVEDVPFPFPALLQRLGERAGCNPAPECVRTVLIPLGRSLQRMSAAPDFFGHPRIVAAVVGEGAGAAALLKDRIYIGYQEKAALLEVISYNEAAGRFEFQLVHDYRAGATPRVNYARREVCAACHQNIAPIFSRPLWAETNANPAVATQLAKHGDAFSGVPVDRGVDIPSAIDTSTDHANLLGVWQRLWRDACGGRDAAGRRCRGAALLAALQYRLSGERGFDESAPGWRNDFLPVFTREWHVHWPAGLAIPNPDLPNRNPFPIDGSTPLAGASLANIPARFEPLLPRAPLETWTLDSAAPGPITPVQIVTRRYIAGLAGFFTIDDVRALDRELQAHAGNGADNRHDYPATCTFDRSQTALHFQCGGTPATDSAQLGGRLALQGGRIAGGVIEGLAIDDGSPLNGIRVTPGLAIDPRGTRIRLQARDLAVRLADGARVDGIELRWNDPDAASATVSVIDDLAPLRDAIAALSSDTHKSTPLSSVHFNRARLTSALFQQLDIDGRTDCCDDASRLQPAQVEPAAPDAPTRGPAQPFAAFYPLCAGCHATRERTPPNFLAGSAAQVVANIRHCAPRMYVRLAMGHRDPALREKTPMPPPFATTSTTAAALPREVDTLERIVAGLLRDQAGHAPQLDALLANGYEALPDCLPAVATAVSP